MHTYDVALSFAGEQRGYVEAVAATLRKHGVSIFYDRFEQGRLWGGDMVAELDRVYRKEARFVVVFISRDYRDKKWTRHEFRSILASAIEQREEFVLPVRFDDTDLDGLPPTVGYLDAKIVRPPQLVKLLLEKLKIPRVRGPEVLEVWRLINRRFVARAFSSEGAALHGGRWSKPGTHVVYSASSRCAAVLEAAVHFPVAPFPDVLAKYVSIGAKLSVSESPKVLSEKQLPKNWDASPHSPQVQEIGTVWANTGSGCVLGVPSSLLLGERTFLINPKHPDFGSLSIFSEEPVSLNKLFALMGR